MNGGRRYDVYIMIRLLDNWTFWDGVPTYRHNYYGHQHIE